jgi:hypothetical protein
MDESKYAAHHAARDGNRECRKQCGRMLIYQVRVVESLLNVSCKAP